MRVGSLVGSAVVLKLKLAVSLLKTGPKRFSWHEINLKSY